MRRIIFICLVVGLAAGVPPPARAQDAYDAHRLEANKKQYPANEDNVAGAFLRFSAETRSLRRKARAQTRGWRR